MSLRHDVPTSPLLPVPCAQVSLGARFLDPSSAESVRVCYERAAVAAHLPALHATVDALVRDAARATEPDAKEVGPRLD